MPDLKITPRERILANRIVKSNPERRRELLERFWYNRMLRKDPGLLSLEQMANYHHAVFEEEGIPRHYYGGTRSKLIPDEWELELYGDLYCHDCDPRP